jgi:hypothetical protein
VLRNGHGGGLTNTTRLSLCYELNRQCDGNTRVDWEENFYDNEANSNTLYPCGEPG